MLSRGTAAETATAALLPSGTRNGLHSPVRRYPWDQAYPALRRLMAGSPMRATLTSLEYSNLLTGAPALATLGCLLQGLPAGAWTRPRRETASSGYRGGPRHRDANLRRPDLRALAQRRSGYPGLDWHQLTASEGELVLLRLTDRPIHDAFGLFQAEEEA